MVATSTTIDFEKEIGPEELAADISLLWRDWGNNFRRKWLQEKKELRNYLFATDTRTTTNSRLPWANSTTTPKLTQIRDNLHANYMAALFPSSKWMRWRAEDRQANTKLIARAVESYIENKTRQSDFVVTMSKLVTDYIDYGNCFGRVEYVNNHTELEDGEVIPGYVGPRLVRISPFDIAFNPTAASFEDSPKIIKKIVNLGDIKNFIKEQPEQSEHLKKVFDTMIGVRNLVRSSDSEIHKSEGYVADGFDNITHYYSTDYVELLEFYGSIYDSATGEFKHNRIITVADRAFILRDVPQPSWLGSDGIHHAGWRERPDNLYAMGPLDNLVGLQYRIDHLENMKADVWDQIAYPVKKIRGDVEEFSGEPGEHIYVGDEGDVEYLAPDATSLNADLQIERLMNIMEEMAGAPRQAMGIRTPGEKTAFEVDALANAADRIFRNRTSHLEKVFIEPILNDMLEIGRRNLNTADVVQVTDEETGGIFFTEVTKADITAKGKIVPLGARHFAERNTRVQQLNQLVSLKAADPSIGVHISGKKIAELLAEELGEPELYTENVTVTEQLETARVAEDAQVQFEEEQLVAAEEGL